MWTTPLPLQSQSRSKLSRQSRTHNASGLWMDGMNWTEYASPTLCSPITGGQ